MTTTKRVKCFKHLVYSYVVLLTVSGWTFCVLEMRECRPSPCTDDSIRWPPREPLRTSAVTWMHFFSNLSFFSVKWSPFAVLPNYVQFSRPALSSITSERVPGAKSPTGELSSTLDRCLYPIALFRYVIGGVLLKTSQEIRKTTLRVRGACYRREHMNIYTPWIAERIKWNFDEALGISINIYNCFTHVM